MCILMIPELSKAFIERPGPTEGRIYVSDAASRAVAKAETSSHGDHGIRHILPRIPSRPIKI